MIGRLHGELVYKRPPHLLVDVRGVGYELEAPMTSFYVLPPPGEPVTLFTHLQIREDAHTLYAFASEAERASFRALLKVTGVGAKLALAILSGMEPQTLGRCLRDGDVDSLVRLPGVGRRTAERLVTELRDRMASAPAIATPAHASAPARTDPVEEAVRALVALGYKPPEASRMVGRVDGQGQSSEEIIRQALKASLS